MTYSSELTSSQKGKIAELYVASILMAASNGRLSAFAPLVDDDGVDLVVLDKKTKNSLPVQVKAWLKGQKGKNKNVKFDARKATFDKTSNIALIGLILDLKTMAMEMSWLFPIAEVPKIANETEDKYALRPSRDNSSKDKYAPYRHESIQSLTQGVLDMIVVD